MVLRAMRTASLGFASSMYVHIVGDLVFDFRRVISGVTVAAD